MKKTRRMFCGFLAAVFLLSALFFGEVQAETVAPLYDNSFMVTVEAESDLDLASYLGVYSCKKTQVKWYPSYISYEAVAIVVDETVEEAMERVSKLSGVVVVTRNTSASDYWEKASYIKLNPSFVAITLGETDYIKIRAANLEGNRYTQIGMEVNVNHNSVSYEEFCLALGNLGEDLIPVARYSQDFDYTAYYDKLVYYRYNGKKETGFFDGPVLERLGTQSPIGTYLIVGENRELTPSEKGDLKNLTGVSGTYPVYALAEDIQPSVEWVVEDGEIATITPTNMDDLCLSAKITGNQVGDTVLTVKYTVGTQWVTETCFVKVYRSPWKEPTGWGDIDGDRTITAKDAMFVLRWGSHKYAHLDLYQPTVETFMKFEEAEWYNRVIPAVGDVNDDQVLDARDALHILKYAVKKITKFQVEQRIPTPTDVAL